MSIKSEIERISGNVSDALAATAEMGANVPETASSNDLGMLIRSIPTGGGVTDYNDLENKPCYTEQWYILPETTVEFDPDTGEGSVADVVNVSVGNTYTVNWNGTEYTCVAQALDMDGDSTVALGDVGAVTDGDSTGEPFVVAFFDSETAAMVGAGVVLCALDGSTSVTLSIIGELVHKLDEKYLPEPVVLYTDDSAKYLYKTRDTSDTNNRITKAELRALWFSPCKIFISSSIGNSIEWRMANGYFETETTCGLVLIDHASTKYIYTAEYTG